MHIVKYKYLISPRKFHTFEDFKHYLQLLTLIMKVKQTQHTINMEL